MVELEHRLKAVEARLDSLVDDYLGGGANSDRNALERAVLWAVARGGKVIVTDTTPSYLDPIVTYVVRDESLVMTGSPNGRVVLYDPLAEDAKDAVAVARRATWTQTGGRAE